MKIIENLRVFYENNGKLCNYSQYKGKFSILLPLLAKKKRDTENPASRFKSILFFPIIVFDYSLGAGKASQWNPVRRTADIVQADSVADVD